MSFNTNIRLDSKKTKKPKLLDLNELGEEITEDLINLTTPLTKRKVLSFMQSQYDPLGLVGPLLLIGKLMLRKLYGEDFTLGWDDPLPPKLAKGWLVFIAEIIRMGPFVFPRTLVQEDTREIWMVAFFDGSTKAHSAVVYLRVRNIDAWGQQSIDSNLLLAKCRVSPLAGTTVPRMELQGMLQASRLMLTVARAMPLRCQRAVLAGDSMCSLMS